eukprot:CAMPEP_0197848274 /NCGR_PEP_ID=MMETSP1438-20131217/8121_1 /TAXON_ID=1461541 /ORGANISM="Pterosperma sp., Strain CCMP1384" /LENGTH=488 /DNA_ID=CAMNT_0043460433 /DNA_START=100 /DNA_END=1566 /DNA_ORIENTATION=+
MAALNSVCNKQAALVSRGTGGPLSQPKRVLHPNRNIASTSLSSTKNSAARTGKFPCRRSVIVQASAEDTTKDRVEEEFDPRQFRRQLGASKLYNRRVSGDEESIRQMDEHGIGIGSEGGIIAQMRDTGFQYTRGDVTLQLAESFGFCWGVERSIQMAYEARNQFKDRTIWITNEIIHNPIVNKRLAEMDVKFIEEDNGDKDFSGVTKGDVVILPAFGASVEEMKLLDERKVNIVDTTCPWVSKVWNAVGMHTKKEATSVIHGKWEHEETIATASFAKIYLIIKNMKECEMVMDYILQKEGCMSKAEFMEHFKNAMSAGFDPDEDLTRVGIANQTTMLRSETTALGKAIERCMMEKYGVENVAQHFMVLDTICDATQERQDAMFSLVDKKPDIMLVVGGFNSSNTSHLQEIAEHNSIPSFWVDQAARVGPGNLVAHSTSTGELLETENWLPEGPVTIGVTSGASTPDRVVEDILDKIFEIKEKSPSAVA